MAVGAPFSRADATVDADAKAAEIVSRNPLTPDPVRTMAIIQVLPPQTSAGVYLPTTFPAVPHWGGGGCGE